MEWRASPYGRIDDGASYTMHTPYEVRGTPCFVAEIYGGLATPLKARKWTTPAMPAIILRFLMLDGELGQKLSSQDFLEFVSEP